jgi:hypothetical protein
VLLSLKPVTWIICGAWLLLVFIGYLVYGRRNATLNDYTSDEQIAEPIHELDEK